MKKRFVDYQRVMNWQCKKIDFFRVNVCTNQKDVIYCGIVRDEIII